MNHESTTENGRYVWAAILIILSVVLASVAFISWIVNSSEEHNAALAESTNDGLYTNTARRSGVSSDKLYDYNTKNDKTTGTKNYKSERDGSYYGENGTASADNGIVGDVADSVKDIGTDIKDGITNGMTNNGTTNNGMTNNGTSNNATTGKTEQ